MKESISPTPRSVIALTGLSPSLDSRRLQTDFASLSKPCHIPDSQSAKATSEKALYACSLRGDPYLTSQEFFSRDRYCVGVSKKNVVQSYGNGVVMDSPR